MNHDPRDLPVGDRPVPVLLGPVERLATGFRPYERHHFSLTAPDGRVVKADRDVVRCGEVIGVLPVDLVRREIVLIRQFRMAAQLATGRGELVEVPAGRVDPGETPRDAAFRECEEEIGLRPTRAVRAMTFLMAPALADEIMSLWVAEVDAQALPSQAGHPDEGEIIQPFRLGFDEAIASVHRDLWRCTPVIIALQWLALNVGRLPDLLRDAT